MTEEITLEAAQAAIRADKQKREAACLTEVQAALDKYNCDLVGIPTLTLDGRITVQQVRVTAKPLTATE